MHFYRLAKSLRLPAIALFSIVLAACGSGDGEDSVDAADVDTAVGEFKLVFEDDFGGPAPPIAPRSAPRTAARGGPITPFGLGNWRVDEGYGPNNAGWGNNEWQLYQNSIDNIFEQDNSLVIRARCSDPDNGDRAINCGVRNGNITSAKIITKDRLNVRYGRIQARIKMPSGAGMWPAFWTLGSDIDERPWPDAGEIDIVEMHYFYSDTRTTHFTTHWSGPKYTPENRPSCASGVLSSLSADEEENCFTKTKTFDDPGDAPITDDFHIFEVEWNERQIVGKIDGITYFTQPIDASTMEEFLKDHYLILNVAYGGNLGNPFGPSPMSEADWADPNKTDMLVDWVRVYEAVPPRAATLIDESGNNLPYNRVINSAEFNGGFADVDLESTAITPLVGTEVMQVKYSATRSENGGGVPAGFTAASFSFNNLDLSDFDTFKFSANYSKFPEIFDNMNLYFVNVTDPDPSQPFLVNLSQIIEITPGETYELSFRAASPFTTRNIIAGIGLNGGPVGGDFRNNTEIVPLTNDMQTFTYTLQAVDDNGGGAFGDNISRVLFDLNGEAGLVLIDDVSLKVQGTTDELLTNGDFEASVPDKAPWINDGEVGTYGPIQVRFEDSFGNSIDLFAGNFETAVNGDWYTYEIPLSELALDGVDPGDINFINFANPFDENFDLLSGTVYLDDIRFEADTTPCNAVPTVAFDSDYNPATSVGQVTVTDACNANSLVTVKVDNGIDEIFVGVKLDAAGVGSTVFGLIDPLSLECSTSDLNGYIALEPPSLLASYPALAETPSAFATAFVDENAPPTTLVGEQLYFYSSNPAIPLSFVPDAPVANSFNYSVFGSGSELDGAFADSFNPVFQVRSGPDYGAEVAQVALINLPAGFAAGRDAINFKFKNVGSPNAAVQVQFGSEIEIVSLADESVSTHIGDGWFEISVPMDRFPSADSATTMVFTSADPAPPIGSGFYFLITDINLRDSIGVVPAACAATSGGGAGSGVVPETVLFSSTGSGEIWC
jgi:beta-glucanase (GH16 family)